MALAYLAVGVLFIIKKGELLNIIMIVAGALFIFQGLVDILKHKENVTGIIKIIIGVAIIVFGLLLLSVALIVLGVLLIVNALTTFVASPKKLISLLSCALSLVLGVLLIVSKGVVTNWLFIVIGVIFIVNGIVMIFGEKK